MLRPFCNISIQQVTPFNYNQDDGNGNLIPTTVTRDKLINIPFCHEYEIDNGWESHTNNCKIKLPKNVRLQIDSDKASALFSQSGTFNAILGGTTNQNQNGLQVTYSPLIMKGDVIYISDGYWYRNKNQKDIATGSTVKPYGQNVFAGYVSNVKSDTPIEINCEDNFYLLKRTPFDSTKWPITKSEQGSNLYSLCKHIIDLVNSAFGNNSKWISNGINPYPILSFFEIPDSISAEFSLGYLDIGDITCGQLLEKLKQQYHFESTFVGNELRFGVTIYDETTATSDKFFAFHDIYNSSHQLQTSCNIFPSHDLEYSNKGDVVLSTIVQCKIINKTGKITKNGEEATKKTRLKILVYWDIPTSTFKYVDLSKSGTVTPVNPDGGERHNCWYPVDLGLPAPTIIQLFELGKQQLNKYFYTGFKGCFTTFGFPYVNWNDNVNLVDSVFSDRNGQYKIKRVKRKFGQHGISQEIHVDYLQQDIELGVLKIRQIPSNTKQIYMI